MTPGDEKPLAVDASQVNWVDCALGELFALAAFVVDARAFFCMDALEQIGEHGGLRRSGRRTLEAERHGRRKLLDGEAIADREHGGKFGEDGVEIGFAG